MLRSATNRLTRKAVQKTSQRFMGGHSALRGDATSPHYADFGYGANQMLPTHELFKNPVPYKWVPRQPAPDMAAGHLPQLHQHQIYNPQATGYGFSIVAGIDHNAEREARQNVIYRIKGTLGYSACLGSLFAYEYYMWDGLQFVQAPMWDNYQEVNHRMMAHSLQWEKSWKEMLFDTPINEVFDIIANRPFKTNNPYRFNAIDFEIADKNVSYRAFEPVLQNMNPEEYRVRANYIMFYVELQEKLRSLVVNGNAKNIEEELSQWLFTQNKYSHAELEEIMAVAPQYNDNFLFHTNAVYDEKANEVVYFEGRHWATVEERLKPEVESLESQKGGIALALAEPLLVRLIKGGPVQSLRDAFTFKVESDTDETQFQRGSLWNFIVMDSDEAAFNKLLKLQQQVLSSTDSSLETFQANAKGLNLPVPSGFSISAINHAIAKSQFANMSTTQMDQLTQVPEILQAFAQSKEY